MANFSFTIAIKCIQSHLCLNRKKPFAVNKHHHTPYVVEVTTESDHACNHNFLYTAIELGMKS